MSLVAARPAGQVEHHARRQFEDSAGGFSLPGPVTITQIVVVPPLPTISSILPSVSVVPPSSSVQDSLSSIPVSSFSLSSTPSASQTMASQTSNPVLDSDTRGKMASGAAAVDSGLPPGAIAGVVLAVLLVLLGLLIFLLRKRLVRHRELRAHAWKDSLFSKRTVTGSPKEDGQLMEQGEANPSFIAASSFAPPMTRMTVSRVPVPAVPPTTYNNPPSAGLQGDRPTSHYDSQQKNSENGYPANPARGMSAAPVNGVTVISTFIPSLPDELSISLGEVVNVMAEFDDGWGMCSKATGEQGMVPLECLDLGGNGTQLEFVPRESLSSRRASSLTARWG